MTHPRKTAPLVVVACLSLAAACGDGGGGDGGPRAEAPTFSPAAPWNFREQVDVTLATATAGAVIHFTTDGSAPTTSSPAYAGPIPLTETATVKAIAVAGGLRDSAVASATFTRRAVDLVLDDGGAEVSLTLVVDEAAPASGFVNRFTPAPGDLPFELRTIRVLFPHLIAAGTEQRLAWYTDPDGDPANGATLEGVLDVTVQANDGVTWSVYALPAPLTVAGPGDVLVALVGAPVSCGVDSTASTSRSFHAWWAAAEDAPALPPSHWFAPSDFGNLMIRASN